MWIKKARESQIKMHLTPLRRQWTWVRESERIRSRGKKKFLFSDCWMQRVKIEEHLKRNSSIKHKIALMISWRRNIEKSFYLRVYIFFWRVLVACMHIIDNWEIIYHLTILENKIKVSPLLRKIRSTSHSITCLQFL